MKWGHYSKNSMFEPSKINIYSKHDFQTLQSEIPPIFIYFVWLHPCHMEVPGTGAQSELKLPANTTVTATLDLNCICDLHCSLWQRRILNPLCEARDQTCILMDTSQVLNPQSHSGNSSTDFLKDQGQGDLTDSESHGAGSRVPQRLMCNYTHTVAHHSLSKPKGRRNWLFRFVEQMGEPRFKRLRTDLSPCCHKGQPPLSPLAGHSVLGDPLYPGFELRATEEQTGNEF